MTKTKNAEYTPAYAKRIARRWSKEYLSISSFAWFRGQQITSRMHEVSTFKSHKP